LQTELACVLAEMEATLARLGLAPTRVPNKKAGVAPKAARRAKTVCPFCGAEFSQALKFCGECGKAIA
jgi:hypothetical protein